MQIKAVLYSFCPFNYGMTFWAPRLENVELLGFNWVETFPLQCVSPNDTNLNPTSLIVIPSVMIFLIIIFLGHVFYLSALNWCFCLMTKHQLLCPLLGSEIFVLYLQSFRCSSLQCELCMTQFISQGQIAMEKVSVAY